MVKEVSAFSVGYNIGSSISCIFQGCEAMVDSGSDGGKFSGGHTTIVCGRFLLAIAKEVLDACVYILNMRTMRRNRLVRFDKIEEIK